MHARVTTMEMNPERVDEAVATLEEEDLPTFRQIDGFRGFTLVLNRTTGKVIATSYWDSEEQMLAAEDQVKGSRQRAAKTGEARAEPSVEVFEVGIDTFIR